MATYWTITLITLDDLIKIINGYIPENPDIVYKSCGDFIVILKKLNDTITNENRCDVVDSKCAKFRANKLFTKMIINKFTGELIPEIANTSYSNKIVYKVGKVMVVDNYDFNINTICAPGIHYFKSIDAAYYFCNIGFLGKYKGYYDSGQIKIERDIVYIIGDKYTHYIEWHNNGKIYIDCNYKNSKLNGIFKKWHKNGSPWIEGNYKNGKLDGICTIWLEGNSKGYEYEYKNGKRCSNSYKLQVNGNECVEISPNDGSYKLQLNDELVEMSLGDGKYKVSKHVKN